MFPTGNAIETVDVPGVGAIEATMINQNFSQQVLKDPKDDAEFRKGVSTSTSAADSRQTSCS